MTELLPIIRRVRRPLVLPVEHQADAKPVIEQPPVAVPAVERSGAQPKRKDKRGKVASAQPAK
jgi:hypothetical protein